MSVTTISKSKKNPKDKNRSNHGVSKKSKTQMKKQKTGSSKKEVVLKSFVSSVAKLTKSSLDSDELLRKKTQDERTLYIKFKENRPSTTEEIKELHPDINAVRNPLLGNKKTTSKGIHYAFLEFETADLCNNAKIKLTDTQFRGRDVFVDFVGENSNKLKKDRLESKELNKTRLFVRGLAPGMTENSLKEMFPKASHTDVPNKKSLKSYGFVQFSNNDDAKDAFDANQNLSIDGHKITVLFSNTSASVDELKQKKAEKRKARKQGSAVKKEESVVKKEESVAKKEESVVKKEESLAKKEGSTKIKTKKVKKVF